MMGYYENEIQMHEELNQFKETMQQLQTLQLEIDEAVKWEASINF